MIAQSHLAAVSTAERIEEGSASGKDGEFAWLVAAAPYDERQETADADRSKDYNLRVRLMRIDVKVGWHAADGRERDVRLATLLLATKP
jgi:hypothetical protein